MQLQQIVNFVCCRLPVQRGTGLSQLRLRFHQVCLRYSGLSIFVPLRVSWTAKKTNEWVLNKAGINRELLDTAKTRKLAYCGHTMRKQGSCLGKVIV